MGKTIGYILKFAGYDAILSKGISTNWYQGLGGCCAHEVSLVWYFWSEFGTKCCENKCLEPLGLSFVENNVVESPGASLHGIAFPISI